MFREGVKKKKYFFKIKKKTARKRNFNITKQTKMSEAVDMETKPYEYHFSDLIRMGQA